MSRYVKSKDNSGTLLLTRPQVCGGIIIRIGLHHLGTHLFTPTMKFAGKLLGLLNLDLGKVFVLPYIPGEIEQLNGSILKIFEEFIITIPNCTSRALHPVVTVMRKMPVNWATVHLLTFDQAGKALAINLLAIELQTEHFENGGIEVSADNRLITDNIFLSLMGPFHNHRHTNTSLVQPTLGSAQGKVGT